MFKPLKELFATPSPEQTYLNERLQSAKWLGWEAPSAPAPAISLLGVAKPVPCPRAADEAHADGLPGNPAASS